MKSPQELKNVFHHWEVTKDLIDQCIDIMLNLRQSGHPGGSRSKVHGMIATLLSGAMRWDIREAGKRFADRFVLVAGHANPVVYATLAVLNEALRIKFSQTGDSRYCHFKGDEFQLVWEDLLMLRRNGGLPGHAEMEGKTLFFKFNTGPSGHGSPPAAGEALALKLAKVPEIKVFAFEGEGGLTTGASHETINSAWGLGLGNLVYFMDWNDYGIDARPFSSIVYGTPEDWFGSHGWHVEGTMDGEDWESLTTAYYRLLVENAKPDHPKVLYAKMRKGRGYHKFDNASHGSAHKRNSELFWKTKSEFTEKYDVQFDNFGEEAPNTWAEQVEQAKSFYNTVFSVLRDNQGLVDYLADTLIEIGDSVPSKMANCRLNSKNPAEDKNIFNINTLPNELFVKPGEKAPNRIGFSKYASYINSIAEKEYGRPLVIAMSADLADSTNISGFAKGWDGQENHGFYDKISNLDSPLMPQGITEFTNAGMMAGLATVNFSEDTYKNFNGFYGAMSTYGSFSYLKYGPIRLFSQIAQDSDLKVGKLIWVAGHTGPETAEDSRTHFGIFAPGVTQLFPDGHIVNIHPWEHNEVAPVLAAAFNTDIPIIGLHLTRPPITIPDRKALGMAPHLDAAKGAYIIKDFVQDKPKEGVVIVRGTSSTNSVVELLPRIIEEGPNVKIVAAISWVLFQQQSETYRNAIIAPDEWHNAMIITNGGRRLMHKWMANRIVEDYSLSPDWDDRWRTGGSLDEIVDEAHLSPRWLWAGITKFAADRDRRLDMIRGGIPV
ncbi:MAG TPA: transketolase [Candidatus Marinimicrobia bacterium]|jgi:transketolase|nr:transketolase [Candidatus Neomarinimicrobiota bacterium]MDP7330210.1 transketolase [Candidatus Neomarinimicrobiota bacterium]HJL74429.1 transketolase [Candidatus Neomarinimicrobiota bacterium]HJM69289.1 transketolase [Candidatus Neomarinimicrobiota bacterium]|tara:strand:+ start:25522 stop:27843 length:2322 start_codon:yes stop_codon:yes gene_type:complete